MCIVIDANTFSSLFKTNSSDHNDFHPVLEWICKGNGKIVYGGSKYNEELRSTKKYNKLFRLFDAQRKVVKINDQEVDNEQARLENLIDHRDFDDPHIIAIIIVSRCKIVCSKDASAYPFIKDKALYSRGFERPRIYSRSSNADLLCDKLIADCCKPTSKTKELNMLLS